MVLLHAGILSFEVTRVLVKESDTVVRVCVRRTGCVNSFRLYTTDLDATGMFTGLG